MAFITFEKANSFLDENKVRFDSAEDLAPELDRAEALIKSRLSSVYPTTYTTWVTPSTTPDLIQDVAGALCAAWRYAKMYSEESVTQSSFGNMLERRALEVLDGIASGAYVLQDGTETPQTQVGSGDMWPNDIVSEDEESEDYSPRAFWMTMEF